MAETDFFAALLDEHERFADASAADVSAHAVTAAFDATASLAGDPRVAPASVDAGRLAELLAPAGFAVESHCPESRTIVLARPSFAADLYESLMLQSAGRHGQVLQARAGVWFGRHGIVAGQSRLLAELAPESRTGILLLVSPESARRAELRLATLAPEACASFARTHGHDVLARLAGVRAPVAAYVSRLRPISAIGDVLNRLMSRASPDEIAFARRLLETPAVRRVDAPQHYLAAALALAVHGESVEGAAHPFRDPPLRGAPTVLRLQLLVHHLLDAAGEAAFAAAGAPALTDPQTAG